MRMTHPQLRMLVFQFMFTLGCATYWLISGWAPAGWGVLGQILVEGFMLLSLIAKAFKNSISTLSHNVKED
jgi:hypothetical protein